MISSLSIIDYNKKLINIKASFVFQYLRLNNGSMIMIHFNSYKISLEVKLYILT